MDVVGPADGLVLYDFGIVGVVDVVVHLGQVGKRQIVEGIDLPFVHRTRRRLSVIDAFCVPYQTRIRLPSAITGTVLLH